NQVGILDINPVVGHRAATERRGKTCHRRSVSDTRLIVEGEDTEAAYDLVSEITGFVGGCRGGQEAGGQPAVDRHAVLVLGLEVLVPVALHEPSDAGEGLRP